MALIRRLIKYWRQRYTSPARRKSIFQHIYDSNRWQNAETRSGHGSSMEQTKVVREALPSLIETMEIRSVIDIPCGDFHWMQHVDLRGANYIGIDIVEGLIAENTKEYGNAHREFRCLDIAVDPLPATDMVFCRDLLVHFSFADISQALANVKRSGATYLLATTFPETASNENILTGNWRRLNLERPPFDLPPPVQLINEGCTEDNGAFRDKSLGLWRVADL